MNTNSSLSSFQSLARGCLLSGPDGSPFLESLLLVAHKDKGSREMNRVSGGPVSTNSNNDIPRPASGRHQLDSE